MPAAPQALHPPLSSQQPGQPFKTVRSWLSPVQQPPVALTEWNPKAPWAWSPATPVLRELARNLGLHERLPLQERPLPALRTAVPTSPDPPTIVTLSGARPDATLTLSPAPSTRLAPHRPGFVLPSRARPGCAVSTLGHGCAGLPEARRVPHTYSGGPGTNRLWDEQSTAKESKINCTFSGV